MTGGVMIDLLTPPTSSLRTPLAPASSARKQYSPASLWLTSMTAEACAWACAEEMHFSAAMAADSLAFDLRQRPATPGSPAGPLFRLCRLPATRRGAAQPVALPGARRTGR